jgi:hypothetical protein
LKQIGREEALEERLEVPGSERCSDQHPQLLPDRRSVVDLYR